MDNKVELTVQGVANSRVQSNAYALILKDDGTRRLPVIIGLPEAQSIAVALEFMPLMAHPLGLRWGYQLMGYFAFEHTYGTPEEFQDFVEECHINNIGVIVDWVPGHFTINDDALAYYDGTPPF